VTSALSRAPRRLRSLEFPRPLAGIATVAGAAAALVAVYQPSFLNYDARYSLVWAHDLWHGRQPDYEAPFAPTPHPLQTAVSSLALPFGDGADVVLIAMVVLSFGGLVWLAYRLGAELFSPWVGGATAAVVLTRPALHRDAAFAYQDVAFAMVVVWAVLLEARSPRRGLPVFVLLAVAGLMRPEAWVLSGLYLLYTWPEASPRLRAANACLTACAPLIWALSDLLVTGDALHSLHGTSGLAEELGRRRDVDRVPYWTAQYLGFVLREPLVVGVPLGLAFAWTARSRRAILPLAVAAAMLAVFALGPVFGLPLVGRYVRTPAVLLSLFYGLAVFGWLLLPDGTPRRRWRALGLLALALSVVYLPKHVDLISGLRDRVDSYGRYYDSLQQVGRSGDVRAAVAACGPLSAADHRPIPHVRWWLRAPPGSVRTVEGDPTSLTSLLLVPRDTRPVRRFYRDAFPQVKPPRDYRRLYRNRDWAVYADPRCR
jgi:hypothetical protein